MSLMQRGSALESHTARKVAKKGLGKKHIANFATAESAISLSVAWVKYLSSENVWLKAKNMKQMKKNRFVIVLYTVQAIIWQNQTHAENQSFRNSKLHLSWKLHMCQIAWKFH